MQICLATREKQTFKLDHLLKNPKKQNFSLSLLIWRSKNPGHVKPAGGGWGEDCLPNFVVKATGKESPPLGVCGSQTKGLPCPLQGGKPGLLSSASSPGTEKAKQKRGFLQCLSCLFRSDTFFKSLSLLALPAPCPTPTGCQLMIAPPQFSQVCQCSASLRLSPSLGTALVSGLWSFAHFISQSLSCKEEFTCPGTRGWGVWHMGLIYSDRFLFSLFPWKESCHLERGALRQG